ncbi:MAG: LysM peptidoglycan-binding domain-containing protein, partial [Rhodanobacter lindaniclasticus]
SQRTVQARAALEERRERAADDARLERVSGSVSNVAVTGVEHASGSATTVSQANGKDFGRVNAGATQARSTYKVVRGDTLSSIAKAHSVDVAQLRAWNRLKSDNLQQGQVLRVSKR